MLVGSKHKLRPQEEGVKNQISDFFSWGGVIVCSKKHTHEYVHFSRHVSVKKFHYFIYWFVEIAAHLIVPFYFI